MGGTVKVESSVGHGTTFTVTLPLATSPPPGVEGALRDEVVQLQSVSEESFASRPRAASDMAASATGLGLGDHGLTSAMATLSGLSGFAVSAAPLAVSQAGTPTATAAPVLAKHKPIRRAKPRVLVIISFA